MSCAECTVATENLNEFLNLIDGFQTKLISTDRVGFTDPGDEIVEFGSILMKQGRARGGAAGGDVPLVEEDGFHPLAGQAISHECAGDPASQDRDLAGLVTIKAG